HRHWRGSTGNGRNPLINGRRQPSCDGTSRMHREAYVRFCERLGVKFPGSTRQTRKWAIEAMMSASDQKAEIRIVRCHVRLVLLASLCSIEKQRAFSPPATMHRLAD